MDFKVDDIVVLKSFHNRQVAPAGIDDRENYWKLIGLKGKILKKKKSILPLDIWDLEYWLNLSMIY